MQPRAKNLSARRAVHSERGQAFNRSAGGSSAVSVRLGDMFEPAAWDSYLQPLVNEHAVPARFTNARHPYPRVRARLVWQHDGEDVIETEAWSWTRDLVLVQVQDRRRQTNGAWLSAADVERVS